jgi:hypothetical protein
MYCDWETVEVVRASKDVKNATISTSLFVLLINDWFNDAMGCSERTASKWGSNGQQSERMRNRDVVE